MSSATNYRSLPTMWWMTKSPFLTFPAFLPVETDALKVATKWTSQSVSHCSNNNLSTVPGSVTPINKQFILQAASPQYGTPWAWSKHRHEVKCGVQRWLSSWFNPALGFQFSWSSFHKYATFDPCHHYLQLSFSFWEIKKDLKLWPLVTTNAARAC